MAPSQQDLSFCWYGGRVRETSISPDSFRALQMSAGVETPRSVAGVPDHIAVRIRSEYALTPV
jgi:hypothetical protein